MSFILDALKKSEHERQRQSVPGLVEAGIARPKPRLPRWVVALCVLLGVNLLVLSIVLLRSGNQRSPTLRSIPAPASPSSASVAGDNRPFSPLDNGAVYAPEIAVPPAAVQPPTTRQPPAARAAPVTTGSADRGARRHDPQLNDDDYKTNEDEVLPSVDQLNLTGAETLPELHLDVHVYATRASDRFVFINMRKYHEGATLQEGPSLERIRRDGVILAYRGVRFLLPRQ